MTDLDLLALGCVVSFIVVAGVYVFARERFAYTDEAVRREPVGVQANAQPIPEKPRSAA